jgi:hypothetical protein
MVAGQATRQHGRGTGMRSRAVIGVAVAVVALATGCGGGGAQDFADEWFEQLASADSAACEGLEFPEDGTDYFQAFGFDYPESVPADEDCAAFLDNATVREGMEGVSATVSDEGETEASGEWSYTAGEVEYAGTFDLVNVDGEWKMAGLSRE